MSDRSLPATPRRLALARKAGAVAHSPTLTTAAAWAGALAALIALAPRLLEELQRGLRHGLLAASPAAASSASSAAASSTTASAAAVVEGTAAAPFAPAPALASVDQLAALVGDSLVAAAQLAAPVALAAALAALVVHLAQTRAVWIPRRALRGAPLPADDLAARAGRGLAQAVRGAALAAAGLGSLIAAAPALAATLILDDGRLLPVTAAVLSSAALAIVAAWVALGAVELVARTLALAAAARMTAEEHREELRASGGAARLWREQRQRASRATFASATSAATTTTTTTTTTSPAPSSRADRLALAGAALLITGDEVCAAIAWHPRRQPAPRLVLARRGRGVEFILALARAGGLPIHRAPELAGQLAALAERPAASSPAPASAASLASAADPQIPRALWPRLADLVALAPPGGRASSGSR